MIGEEIYGYRIERALSADKGGFGDVYIARHTTSGADAIVKLLKAELSASEELVTRFFNESRAAAAIHHPGIVSVHNVGYSHGRAYLLMERLRGEDLESRLARGTLSLEVALRFLRQVAGAIGAAHERGIVHRDLKPANLFVVPDPDVVGGERIKVLDFGIAKLSLGGTMKTQGVFGTPAYMAPEQCLNAGDVDGRTDLYALGCILFEMLAGKPPFGFGGLELIACHMRDEPPLLTTLVPAMPTAVASLVKRLLMKDRQDRFPSCASLIEAIDAAQRPDHLAVHSQPTIVAANVALFRAESPEAIANRHVHTTLGSAAAAVTPNKPSRPGRRVIAIGGVALAVAGCAGAIVLVELNRGDDVSVQNSNAGDLQRRAEANSVDAGAPRVASPAVSASSIPTDASEADNHRDAMPEIGSITTGSLDAATSVDAQSSTSATDAGVGVPLQLDRDAFMEGMKQQAGRIYARCKSTGITGTINATVAVTSAGRVSDVHLEEELDHYGQYTDPLGDCVGPLVYGATFGRTQRGGRFTYRFVFK
jgi:hypothetical protein